MRTKEGDAIHAVLRAHQGAENSISAPAICRELRWSTSRERQVRRIIADESCLWDDVVICGTPGQGYFAALRFDEVEQYANWLSNIAATAGEKFASFLRAAHAQGFALSALVAVAPPAPAAP